MARIENNLAEMVNKHNSIKDLIRLQKSCLRLQYWSHEIGAYFNFLLPYSEDAINFFIFHENGIWNNKSVHLLMEC